jgi:hypothetical protein
MLAGRVKLKNFLLAVGLGGVVTVGAGAWWVSQDDTASRLRADELQAKYEADSVEPAPSPVDAAAPADPGELTELHRAILGKLGHDLGTAKLQDAVPGPSKVNVYQDAGQAVANRAKVDLDRDDQDDEKWTFVEGRVERQVSPNDDGQYTVTWTLVGDRWADKAGSSRSVDVAGAPGSATAMPASATDVPMSRDVDRAVVQWRGKALGSDKIKDATTGQPFKVNVYQDAGRATANRAKVDLDRDDKWDEKWTFEADGRVIRDVAPGDDDVYTVKEVWQGGRWVPRP